MNQTSWYGVRTLFRLVAKGKPQTPDKFFDPTTTLVEDRVVLFEADSFKGTIEQAKREARNYSKKTRFVNIYGQSVHLKFLGVVNAFAIADDRPSAGTEAYSETAIVHRSVSNAKLVMERLGKQEREPKARYKFIDGAILSDALTAQQPRDRAVRPRKRKRI